MQLALSIHTNSSAEIDRLDGLIESLKQVRVEARQGVDFNQLEAEVGRIFNQAQRGILTSLLEEYDINVPSFEHQENTYRQASRSTKRYMTAAGEILAQRSLYRDRRNGETYCPMELHSGIIEGFWTPKAAKQAIHMVSLITPVEAHRLFEELGAMCPSNSSLTRLPSKLNATIEVKPEDLQEKLKRAVHCATGCRHC